MKYVITRGGVQVAELCRRTNALHVEFPVICYTCSAAWRSKGSGLMIFHWSKCKDCH